MKQIDETKRSATTPEYMKQIGETNTQIDGWMDKWMDRLIDCQILTDRQTNKQRDRLYKQ